MSTSRIYLLTTVAALALLADRSGAYAADLPMKSAAVAPAIPYTTWQGGYIGGTVGAARMNVTANQTGTNDPGYGVCSSSRGYPGGNSCATSASGATIGVQAGYDWQNRYFVYGVVADWSWTNLNHTATMLGSSSSSMPFMRAQMNWMATFRGRMGLAVDDTLVYMTGGLALGDIKSSLGCSVASFYCPSNISPNAVKLGWVAGVGAEHKLSQNWSVLGEFLYYDFGTTSTTGHSPDGSYSYSTEFSHEVFQAKVGLNYRF